MSTIAGGTAFDLLLPNSRCDLLTVAVPFGLGAATLISRSMVVEDDLALAFTAADANREVRLGGVDQSGKPISSVGFSMETPYSSGYDLQFPPTSKFRTMVLQMLSSEPLRTSDLPDGFTLTVSEMLFDFPHRSIYSIHHPSLHGVHESTTLSSLPSDLRHGRVTVAPQGPGSTLHAMMGFMSQGFLGSSGFHPSATLENGWSGDLYLTPEASPDAWGAVGFHTGRVEEGVWMDWSTPMFRVAGDQIVASNEPVPSPFAYRVAVGGTIATGEAPLHPETVLQTNGTAFRIFASLMGPVSEFAYHATAGFTYELRDGAGALLREGTSDAYSVTADFGSTGVYRANMRMKTGQQVSLVFDTSRPYFNPPSLTSLRVVDAEGHVVSRVARGTPLTLQFSVVDAEALRPTRASWRLAGKEWHELPLTVVQSDRDYRADLSPVTAAITNRIELRIELEDEWGNSSTSIFDYPLTVQRTRAVGK